MLSIFDMETCSDLETLINNESYKIYLQYRISLKINIAKYLMMKPKRKNLSKFPKDKCDENILFHEIMNLFNILNLSKVNQFIMIDISGECKI